MAVRVRALESGEWRAFRDLRLHALRTEPGLFASSYAAEADFGEAEWRRRIGGEDHQTFGAFDGERLVGITGVITARDNPSGETAMLVMSYVLPEYRGRGVSSAYYEARLAWLRERPRYKRVVVSHRGSNEPSRRANQRFEFVLVHSVPTRWPDGTVEDEVMYELRLDPEETAATTAGDTSLRDACDDDFAALIRGDATLSDGLAVPPGGVDDAAVLGHIRGMAARVRGGAFRGGHWLIVARGEVVGSIGYKHLPLPNGEVEIGYGIAPARRRRGHATRAIALLLGIARADPAVRTVLADTALENRASQRALEKNGFERVGPRIDPTDGEPVIRWRIAVADG
ncbi:MAG TPA: GNAT family N-acetyltransferase [Candidatus Elarobacter sp.]|jgi:RimJ/RimL family protein N-acetyltransferase|nr:GNAT family N-acetyltransferase [Candidatus Elarobacter sp.]